MPDTQLSVSAHAEFEELYRRHGGRVLAYVLRRASPDVADDVVADVFLVAWRKLDNLPADPLPWLLGAARKVLANRRRGEERVAALHRRLAFESGIVTMGGVGVGVGVGVGGGGGGGGEDVDERVIRALAQLRERDREVLMLLAWDGLSQDQAAQVLGLRKNTVAVRLHRARQHFAAALAAQDATTPDRTEVSR
jgi:RNA polymerase sigma-70 factor (ECF subfamily)